MPIRELAPWQALTLEQDFENFCLWGGIATGKSYIGANWAIDRIRERPDLRGFIGANTHLQLSQVTLQEFYHWLSEYRISYVINCIPPQEWQPRYFQNYDGVTTVRLETGAATNVFTRVLSHGDNLRGLEFGWYWIDETRDTSQYTHDVILGRLRQDPEYRRGLLTTSTNGKDWSYKRFLLGAKAKSKLYGSCHVSTREAVAWGIISEGYLQSLLGSYSALMALQEIDAKHVNIYGGRAYHGWHEACERRTAPWGDRYPNRERPLIVGMDFNFSPAPCIWVFGQTGPAGYEHCIHWFGEIAMNQVATETMAHALCTQCPGFYYRVFGDASGTRGTTSNAGEVDYAKIAGVFDQDPQCVGYGIDVDQANPRVKDRVETVNSMMTNALGEHRMTYNPDTCPHLHEDLEYVGWGASGKLEGENERHTHAADGVGYAIWKLFGPDSVIGLPESVPSPYRS